jgi:hypothetical protein
MKIINFWSTEYHVVDKDNKIYYKGTYLGCFKYLDKSNI